MRVRRQEPRLQVVELSGETRLERLRKVRRWLELVKRLHRSPPAKGIRHVH